MLAEDIDTLAEKLGNELLKKQWTVTTAESCTGGGIACAITEIAGSSQWFSQSVVTYSNAAKHALLEVSSATLEDYGAVSEQTVQEMLAGVLRLGAANVALAVSGVAGPGGGTEEKPVGTVWIGCTVNNHSIVRQYHFRGGRRDVRNNTVKQALLLTLEMLSAVTVEN